MFDNAVMFIPSFICKYLMYIGNKNNISLYKHIETRRYINVDKMEISIGLITVYMN